ncbi:unnamed protein product [Brassica rapa]|uniref:Uncharacterized protein n=1 Tax=Brassica campestris TaxID=3711 RepID=A0A8D9DCN9_BRACM|nr:unnamed protein product [Brassica rapa]
MKGDYIGLIKYIQVLIFGYATDYGDKSYCGKGFSLLRGMLSGSRTLALSTHLHVLLINICTKHCFYLRVLGTRRVNVPLVFATMHYHQLGRPRWFIRRHVVRDRLNVLEARFRKLPQGSDSDSGSEAGSGRPMKLPCNVAVDDN